MVPQGGLRSRCQVLRLFVVLVPCSVQRLFARQLPGAGPLTLCHKPLHSPPPLLTSVYAFICIYHFYIFSKLLFCALPQHPCRLPSGRRCSGNKLAEPPGSQSTSSIKLSTFIFGFVISLYFYIVFIVFWRIIA